MSDDPSGGWVRDVLDFIRSSSSTKVFIAVFLISGCAVTLPHTWREKIGIAMWVNAFWPWLVVICAFSGLMLILSAEN